MGIIVIGAGDAGLATAIHWATMSPEITIVTDVGQVDISYESYRIPIEIIDYAYYFKEELSIGDYYLPGYENTYCNPCTVTKIYHRPRDVID